MKKAVKSAAVILVILVMFGAAGFILTNNKAKSEAKVNSIIVKPFAVSVAAAGTQEISESLSLVGTIAASREVAVASETSGRIISIAMEVGSAKSTGSLLVKVDDELKQTAVTLAEVNLEKARKDLDRLQMVQQVNAVPDQQIDNARLAVQAAEAQLTIARRQLKDTRILAPISGSISARFVEVGAMVQPGTVVANLVDISSLKVKLNVPEEDVFNIKIGDRVAVTTEVYPGVTFSGRIENIGTKADEAHTYPVEINIPNSHEHPLKAGMFGRVAFNDNSSRNSLVIPRAAVIGSVKKPQVYVVRNGVAMLRDILTGVQVGTNVEVLRGLEPGEQVVIGGQNNLRDSMTVEIMK